MGPAIKLAVVCSSNMNRSMEAHAFLKKKGFDVESFGTGEKVKIPGKSAREPNVYPFGTTYEYIYQDLVTKDNRLYTENGLLHMLDRNRRLKKQPERFQESPEKFDIILTVEEKVYDQVLTSFEKRESGGDIPVHVINMDVVDNHEDATIGAFFLCDLVQNIANAEDLDDDIEDILQEFEGKSQREILHTVLFY